MDSKGQQWTGKREPYDQLTDSQKALVGKRAAEYGVTSSICHFKKLHPELNLKETTVRRFKKEYLAEIKKRRREETIEPLKSTVV